jgi:hypothetical protein
MMMMMMTMMMPHYDEWLASSESEIQHNIGHDDDDWAISEEAETPQQYTNMMVFGQTLQSS